MTTLIAVATWGLAIWLIWRDTSHRPGLSPALWIPTLWAGILLSRPLSAWTGFGGARGGTGSMEGSSTDALFYFAMIVAAAIILSKRQLNWSTVVSSNWPVFLFYGYLLVSVTWAEASGVSFKRWVKDFGNIVVALVILTETDPRQALRAVFLRCSYVLLPLSIVFVRYFPDLGRRYNVHSGDMEAIGVTMQKNSLGALVLICSLLLIWEWIEQSKEDLRQAGWIDRCMRFLPLAYLSMGVYLLHLCDSKTSISALVVGSAVLASVKLPVIRQRIGALGNYTVAAIIGLWALDSLFGIKESVVHGLGRDMTFTGRTDVWREILGLDIDPIIGTGFCSFWSNNYYLSRLPEWVAFSAHNGYIETYVDGGAIGVALLSLMLIAVGLKVNRQLSYGDNYTLFRFSVLLVTILANFSESHFGRMSPLGFLFLLAAVDPPWADREMADNDELSEEDSAELAPIGIAPGDMAARLMQPAGA
jgi:exopolysaccharide production protein ExoQ